MVYKELDTIDPMMAQEEIDLIKKYLKRDMVMLEWGMGGTTIEFSPLVKKYYCIDHCEDWYDNVLKIIKTNNMTNIYSELSKDDTGENYIYYPDRLKEEKYDVVFIDGRNRLPCALKATEYIDKNSIVFIHDFINRPQYHLALQYYDIVESFYKIGEYPINETYKNIAALRLK